MNLMNIGQKQLEDGTLNDMLKQVGINDVGSFVSQFRNKANQDAGTGGTAGSQQPDLASMGSSLLNQFGGGSKKGKSSGSGDLIGGAMSAYKMFSGDKGSSGGGGQAASSGGSSTDMIAGAMKAYKSFSGGKGTGTGGGGGGILDNIGSAVDGAQQMNGLLKQLDKNGDGKVTIDDIQLLLQGLGLGSVSPFLSKALFKAVDKNQNGQLDLTDVMALAAIVSKLNGKFGSGAGQQAQSVPQN